MKLAEVLRLAYATAGQNLGTDLFTHMAEAVEAEYGPMVHRAVEQQPDGSALVFVTAVVGESRLGRTVALSPDQQRAEPGVWPVFRAVVDAETELRQRSPELSPIHYINGGEK